MVSIGAAVLAISTIAIGVNEGVNAMTGYNFGRNVMSNTAYDIFSTVTAMGG